MTDGNRGAGRRGTGLRALCFLLCLTQAACTPGLSAGRRDQAENHNPQEKLDDLLELESLLPVSLGPRPPGAQQPGRDAPPRPPGNPQDHASSLPSAGHPQGVGSPSRSGAGPASNGTSPVLSPPQAPAAAASPGDAGVPKVPGRRDPPQLEFTSEDLLPAEHAAPEEPPPPSSSRYSPEANLGWRGLQESADSTGNASERVAFADLVEDELFGSRGFLGGVQDLSDVREFEKFLPAENLERIRREADNTVSSGDDCSNNGNCPANENCATLPQGQFCVCDSGFERPLQQGTAGDCKDIDECTCGTHNCSSPLTCRNTQGAFECECPSGLPPDDQGSCEGLYPYGTSVADSTMGYFDDATTPVYTDVGFPVGTTRYSWIYIGSNGVISFQTRYNSPCPYVYYNDIYYNNYYSYNYNYYNSYYSTYSFYSNNYNYYNYYNNYYFYRYNYFNRPRVIAPFWTDISLRGNRGGNIFYHIYKGECETSRVTNCILRRANTDISTYMRRSSFRATWVMVVTWVNVEPYSYSPYYSWRWWWWNSRYSPGYLRSREQITFQCVLISDGRESYSLFFYKHGNFAWRYKYGRRIVIGSIGLSGRFSTVHHSYGSSAFIMDRLVGNTGKRGFWAFRVGRHYSAAQSCLNWYNCNKGDSRMRFLANMLPTCPCAPRRLAWDRRWGRPFNRGRYRCFTLRPQSWLYPLGKECCYLNGFFVTRRPYAGSAFRYHPRYDWRRHQTEDVQAKRNCCHRSSLCHLYYALRPTGTCTRLSWWQEAALFGDPHILTLDGKSYTFNGWGEYTMLDVSTENQTFVLQGRTSLAETENGTLSNATVFSAFAAKDSQNASVYVALNQNKTGMIIFGNERDESNAFAADELYEYESPTLTLSRENDSLIVYFADSGASLKVTVGINLLTLTVTLPNNWKNHTRGLLGNFNGDATDDFLAKNGTTLPDNSSDEDIHKYFGNSWEVTREESVLRYPPGKSHADFQHPEFIPIYLDQVDPAVVNRSYEVCGGRENLACVYDYVATGSARIASASAISRNETMAAQVELAKEFPDLSVANDVVEATVNETVTLNLQGSNPDSSKVTYHLAEEEEGVSVNMSTGVASIRLVDLQERTASFYAENADGLKSPELTVTLVVCSGCSGHGSCNYSDTTRTDVSNTSNPNYRVATCECEVGWTGADCESDLDACAGNPCPQGQNCTDLDPAAHKAQADAASANVSADELGFNCSACPLGFRLEEGKCTDIDECNVTNNPCDQRCENTEGSYRCSCNDGYRLVNGTCVDIDECLERSAGCEQVCNNTPGSYTCACEEGFQLQEDGRNCSLTDAARCSALNCSYGCRNTTSGLACFCARGYTLVNGTACENVNECRLTSKPCHQKCVDRTPGFQCSCFRGFILSAADGVTCLPCGDNQFGEDCSQTCQCGDQATRCDPVVGCVCQSGWKGDACTEDIDECLLGTYNCSSQQVCANTPGSYECQCPSGYTKEGENCTNVNECDDAELNDCTIDQVCRDTNGSYACDCKVGLSGPNCTDIDECQSLQSGCSQLCHNLDGSFNCDCHPGYVLADDRRTCEQAGAAQDCANSNCSSGCTVNPDTNTTSCFCAPGFRLASDNTTCEDIDECAGNSSSCSHNCNNTEGNYVCSCPAGFSIDNDGRTCRECDSSHWGENCANLCNCGVGGGGCDRVTGCNCTTGYNNTDGGPCQEVNECESSATCPAIAKCSNTPGSFRCDCDPGFTYVSANRTCKDVNECLSNPCDQTCTNTPGSFNCTCNEGFKLVNNTRCEDIDECGLNTSGCEQECQNTLGSFTCGCRPGFEVDPDNLLACKNIDECLSNPCAQNCTDTEGGFTCSCSAGYTANGIGCDDVDECQNNNGGCAQICSNTEGSFECSCRPGYVPNSSDGKACIDIDECSVSSANNCTVLEDCRNTVGGFTCDCKSGYERNQTRGCIDIDECAAPKPCPDRKSCSNRDGGFSCTCEDQYKVAANGSCLDTKDYPLEMNLELPFTGDTPTFREKLKDLIKQHYASTIGVDGAVFDFDLLSVQPGNLTLVNGTLQIDEDRLPQSDAQVAKATSVARTQGLQGNDSTSVPVNSLRLQGQPVSDAESPCEVYEKLSPCNGTQCQVVDGLPSCQPLSAPATDSLPLILGLSIGLPLLLLAIIAALAIYACCRIRRRRRAERERQERGAFYGTVGPILGSALPTRYHGKSRLLYEPDTLSSASSGDGRRAARPDFQDSAWFNTSDQPSQPSGSGNGPNSNFSWDFLFKAFQPDGEFKIERPQIMPRPNDVFNAGGRLPHSSA